MHDTVNRCDIARSGVLEDHVLALGQRSSVNSSDQSYASRIASIARTTTGSRLTNSLFDDSDDQIEPALLPSFSLVKPLRVAL